MKPHNNYFSQAEGIPIHKRQQLLILCRKKQHAIRNQTRNPITPHLNTKTWALASGHDTFLRSLYF
jgi:hypothetical protein